MQPELSMDASVCAQGCPDTTRTVLQRDCLELLSLLGSSTVFCKCDDKDPERSIFSPPYGRPVSAGHEK